MSKIHDRLADLKSRYTDFPLKEGFSLRFMNEAEFTPLCEALTPKVFQGVARVQVGTLLSNEERNQMADLNSLMGVKMLTLHFGIYHKGEFIGWHVGDQKSREEFYMRNSGVLPEFQGRGLYTAMLKTVLHEVAALGFQVISSRHNATNNRVIIPKLKLGFTITGLELSDRFGTLVRLEYYTNPGRREIMDYRCGFIDPPAIIRNK